MGSTFIYMYIHIHIYEKQQSGYPRDLAKDTETGRELVFGSQNAKRYKSKVCMKISHW